MHISNGNSLVASLAAALLAACVPAIVEPVTGTTGLAGWYTQQGGRGQFRPCGGATALQVDNGEAMTSRARDFGLQDGDPVYVKVHGERIGATLYLKSVDQFGSPTPVRDCPMGGTTIQG